MPTNFFGDPPAKKPRARPVGTAEKKAKRTPGTVDWEAGRAYSEDWRDDLAKTEGGKIFRTLNNVLIALRQADVWKGCFGWNLFSSRLTVLRALPGSLSPGIIPRELTEPDITNVTDWMQHAGIIVGSSIVAEALRAVADEEAFHPVREYLHNLAWDGTRRLDSWMTDYLGVEDTSLHRAFASRWMIGLVARVFEPGCQFDTALILESHQGLKKSTALRVLGEPWFTDHVPDLHTKDAFEQLQGVWLIELAELTSFNKAESQRIKSFLTTRIDRFRPSFGRVAADHPRQCGFAGTINPGSDGYLRDETGARRFWIVLCAVGWKQGRQIDIAALSAVRDQLWAEAVSRYRTGEAWWLDTEELENQQVISAEERQIDDPREPKVWKFVENLAWVRMDQILGGECLNIPVERWSRALRTEIGYIMSALKWRRRRKKTTDGNLEWRYYPPGDEVEEGVLEGEIINPEDIPF